MSQPFEFERLVELCRRAHEETRRSAARAVDRSLVVRNWLFGWYIVEYEGGGSTRRELYGKELIARLAARLRANGIKGCSPTNLWKCREFYEAFPEIPQTVSVESFTPLLTGAPNLAKLAERFLLGWSHYVILLSISDPDARRFYENEASDNGWSVRELKRQLDSSLYERLALSRDKHEVRRLAREGQVVEKATDLIKDPGVLEFLRLGERPACDRKKDAVVELTLPEDANIYAWKYQRYMPPPKQELAVQFANAWREFEQREGGPDA